MDLSDLIDRYRGLKKHFRYGLVALVPLLPAFMYWSNQVESLDYRRTTVDTELQAERQKFESSKQKIAEFPALMAKLTEVEEELLKAKKILPDQIEMEEILSALGKLEKDLNVKIAKFTPGIESQPNSELDYKEVPVELVLKAPFPQTMRFLDRLVHMPNLTHLRNIQFGSQNQAQRKGGEDIGEASPELESSARLILFKGI